MFLKLLLTDISLYFYQVKAKEKHHKNHKSLAQNHRHLKYQNIAPLMFSLAVVDFLKASTRLVG